MDRTVDIVLIKEHIEYDDAGVAFKKRSPGKPAYAQIRSISRAEWFDAGRNGMRPDICFVTSAFDYDGEDIVEWNGQIYAIYRTFFARSDKVELYCEKKGGVQDGKTHQG